MGAGAGTAALGMGPTAPSTHHPQAGTFQPRESPRAAFWWLRRLVSCHTTKSLQGKSLGSMLDLALVPAGLESLRHPPSSQTWGET